MSINIQTISNKSEFNNFFSQPITFPKTAMISLPKANFQVPIFVNPEIVAPIILAGEEANTAFACEIDGVSVSITWNDIYVAHSALPGCENIAAIGVNNYYGNYTYLPCNQLLFSRGGNLEIKTDFNTIIAKAIDDKFDFYSVTPNSTFNKSTLRNSQISRTSVGTPAGASFLESVDNFELTEIGFNVEYYPYGIFSKALTTVNVNNDVLVNWVQGGPASSLLATTGDCITYLNQIDMDYNGGFVTTSPNLVIVGAGAAPAIAWGLQFVGRGSQAGDVKIPPVGYVYNTNVVDIGIEWKLDIAGNRVFEIIDTSVGTVPSEASNGFNNDADNFFIQIQRGPIYSGTTKYIVNILQGNTNTPHTDEFNRVIYTTTLELNNAEIRLVPVHTANADAATNSCEFTGIRYIQKTDQTLEQGQITSLYHNKSFNIQPVIDGTLTFPEFVSDFFSAWGLFSRNIGVPYDVNNKLFFDYEGTDYLRTWKNKVSLENGVIKYIVGNKIYSQMFQIDETGNYIELNTSNSVNNLPQILNVNINNLDIKNFAGTFVGSTITDAKSGDNRLVGTVPLPINEVTLQSTAIDISYEPFNLLYRPINNPAPFTINQFQVEVYYNDFNTNRRKNIDTINGTMNLEFHVKSGVKPPPIVNNLRNF